MSTLEQEHAELLALTRAQQQRIAELERELEAARRAQEAPPASTSQSSGHALLGRLRMLGGYVVRNRRLPPLALMRQGSSHAAQPQAAQPHAAGGDADYQARLARENSIFADQVNVHALPEIFHYWSNKYLLPMEQAFGFDHPDRLFSRHLLESARRCGDAVPRFVSIGAGNCDTEVRVAAELVAAGLDRFEIHCMDINHAMLERGRAAAHAAGLGTRLVPLLGDFNAWVPAERYAGVMANQSLHHVVELEHLFASVQRALAPGASFVVSDMIGRNGHQRWPEAAAIVREFWAELPARHRYNVQLRRHEEMFIDWDCSVEGFEGVRAQDILPLLLQRFGFEMFLAFGNVIDPFIDRGFGHHFDPDGEWDRDFIDRVHARDEQALLRGEIKPTHMMAVLSADMSVPCRHRDGLSPRFCVRAV